MAERVGRGDNPLASPQCTVGRIWGLEGEDRANGVLRSRSSPSTGGWGLKIALIRGRLIYSLFKHLHGYFVINQTKSLIPQYPTPNISQPSLGVHASSLDTAGKLASHQRSTGTPCSQHP